MQDYHFKTLNKSAEYVISILLSQGNKTALAEMSVLIISHLFFVFFLLMIGMKCYSKPFTIRLVIVAWGLSAFVLIYAYRGILTSFVSAPNQQVLVNSIVEVHEKPDLKVAVIKGRAADLIISVRGPLLI
jgi:high-affinity Fe2+/Pb2+ permease